MTNTITVTLHNVNRTGEVIGIAVANGINQTSSIQFRLSDEQTQALRTEALQKAVNRTRADAGTVASSLGLQIIKIITIRDVDISGGYTLVLYDNYLFAPAQKSSAPIPTQPGEITVTATVSIT